MTATTLQPDMLRRLKWRARRGLLENDVILTRFFDCYEHTLDSNQIDALGILLEQSDNELLDLLLARTQPTGAADTPAVRALLSIMHSI